jgi:quinoprotein glucose dehydrogenase
MRFKIFIIFILLILISALILTPVSCKKITNNCIKDIKINTLNLIKKNQNVYEFSKALYWRFFKDISDYEYVFIKKSKDDFDDKLKTNKKIIYGILGNKYYTKKKQNILDEEINFWVRSHGGNHNLKYSNTSSINEKNISNLKLAWKHQSIKTNDLKDKWINTTQANPIYFDNKLISFFPDGSIKALNPLNGKIFWEFRDSNKSRSGRGILGFNSLNQKKYIFFSFGKYVHKINTSDGKPDLNFGQNGKIETFTLVAPTNFNNQLVIVNLKSISLFDINTGEFKFKVDIYNKNNPKHEGRVWGGSALDEKKGIIYIATGNPKPATYGAYRVNKDKYSNSIIAIDLSKKKIKWKFQEIYHDLWDLDISSPPILHNLKINNHVYEVVIANTKAGNTLVLERNSGKSLFDIHFKKSPKSNIPGENSFPKQIYTYLPEKFSKIDFSQKDFDMLDEDKKNEIKKKLYNSKYGWYETPSLTKDLIIFGIHGGAQWHGSALDPFKQHLYIPTNNVPWKIRPFAQDISIFSKFTPSQVKEGKQIYNSKCSSCHGLKRNGSRLKSGEKQIYNIPSLVGLTLEDKINNSKFLTKELVLKKHKDLNITDNEIEELYKYFEWKDDYLYKENNIIISSDYSSWSQFLTDDGLPGSNPPWGYIAKIDLNNGDLIYKSPIGKEKIDGHTKMIGTPIFGGISINKNLIFANGTADKYAYILNSDNGEVVWSYEMEAAGSSPPIIFKHDGREYVSFVSTGGNYFKYKEKGSTIYTFTIQ